MKHVLTPGTGLTHLLKTWDKPSTHITGVTQSRWQGDVSHASSRTWKALEPRVSNIKPGLPAATFHFSPRSRNTLAKSRNSTWAALLLGCACLLAFLFLSVIVLSKEGAASVHPTSQPKLLVAPMSAAVVRPVSKVARGVKAMEGAGVRITRTIGVGNLRVDPFLMLDEVKSALLPLLPFTSCALRPRGEKL